ncbi:TolC family protein [Silanimonas sp.]|uniref:TolC family protein n=1 Tax=Silanimonas sp. TaxID=1929290 RepID=UPI0022CB9866|nr:TolC family protein [Silanimonas sp.]MCZ8063591.1 TolC family protein [Silanimonas sp.]
MPAAFTPADGTAPVPARLDWWKQFDDPLLDALVTDALAYNRELAAATANLRAAHALHAEGGAQRAPGGGVTGSRLRLRQSALSQPPMEGAPLLFDTQRIVDAGLALAWEIDVFGALAANETAARADAEATWWLRRHAEAAVVAETVRAYVDLQASSGRQARQRERIETLVAIADRLQRAQAIGGLARDEVEQAVAALEGQRAGLPLLEVEARNAARRLAVLTGRTPQHGLQLMADWKRAAVIAPPTLNVGDPAGLLRQRPDVGAAERRLQAAVARTGVATAALYPRIVLLGEAGVAAPPGGLDDKGAIRFAAGPRLEWGIFDLARTRARIAASEAGAEAALAEWEHATLRALEEADAAIDGWTAERTALASAASAAAASERAAAAAHTRLARGLASPLDVSRAEVERLLAEADAFERGVSTTHAWVNAHLALGAGWRDSGLDVAERGAED